jgi:GNAT superfamily N-acetyltransferase
MPQPTGKYLVSTAPRMLDLDFVCRALRATYWAGSRPRSVIAKSVRDSLCFGIYEKRGKRQVAFARVVTDGCTFSWVCDVVVDEKERGKGLGKLLMSSIVAHPRVRNTRSILVTRDAHGLYQKFGFSRMEMMTRKPAQGSRP